jgi:hypothetical protein
MYLYREAPLIVPLQKGPITYREAPLMYLYMEAPLIVPLQKGPTYLQGGTTYVPVHGGTSYCTFTERPYLPTGRHHFCTYTGRHLLLYLSERPYLSTGISTFYYTFTERPHLPTWRHHLLGTSNTDRYHISTQVHATSYLHRRASFTARGTLFSYIHVGGAPLTYTGGHQSSWSDELPHPPRAVQGARVGEAGSVSATDKHSFTHVTRQVNVAF